MAMGDKIEGHSTTSRNHPKPYTIFRGTEGMGTGTLRQTSKHEEKSEGRANNSRSGAEHGGATSTVLAGGDWRVPVGGAIVRAHPPGQGGEDGGAHRPSSLRGMLAAWRAGMTLARGGHTLDKRSCSLVWAN
ncbi:unnamed protein product [Prunus armeniaca]|uniref:Uncharacterized protein n=1 Tax=Prunus armeniaca TaxID=36596 RepID=A0A6J5XWA2_PRUAR|nr:unnamed protein product [Prunus armeniaca]